MAARASLSWLTAVEFGDSRKPHDDGLLDWFQLHNGGLKERHQDRDQQDVVPQRCIQWPMR
jgi:hypothetical protein